MGRLALRALVHLRAARPRLRGAVALGYMILFLLNLGDMTVIAQDYSVEGVVALFRNPNLALLGGVHFLAVDLWVGSWQAEDAARRHLPRAMLPPCLLPTCAFGPLGLLLYLAMPRKARPPAT